MFGQLIDILVKRDSDRKEIIYLFLKVLFTGALTAYFYEAIRGPFDIISITNFGDIVNYFIKGDAIITFGLFYITWTVSYEITSIMASILAFWLSSKLYEVIQSLVHNPNQLTFEIERSQSFKKWAKRYVYLFNIIDIIEIENNEVKAGRQFYKFYDYLIDIDEDKKAVDKGDFIDTMVLCLQFVVLYNLLDLDFLTVNIWVLILAILIVTILLFFSFMAYVLATMVDIKHGRLLKLMNKIEPDYYTEDEKKETSKKEE